MKYLQQKYMLWNYELMIKQRTIGKGIYLDGKCSWEDKYQKKLKYLYVLDLMSYNDTVNRRP